MIKICIPSYKRHNDVLALKEVSPENQTKYYWLCVRDEEIDQYKKSYPYCNYLNLGTNFKDGGIVETRQRINEMMSGKILVIDDDVTFRKTRVHETESFHYMRYDNSSTANTVLDQMLTTISKLMDDNPHGSIRSLQQPRDARTWMPYTKNKTCLWAVWFNLDLIDTNQISYRGGPENAEDIYMSCQFFNLGYDLINVCEWSIKKFKVTNSQEGGCTLDNRGDIHDKSVRYLVDKFPHLCRSKKSNAYGGELGVVCTLKRSKTQKLF